MSPAARPTVTPGRAFLVLVAGLFVLGLVGWLVQGAGDDETVPTVPPTTAPPATAPPSTAPPALARPSTAPTTATLP